MRGVVPLPLTREVVYAQSLPSLLNPGGGLCAEFSLL